MNERREIIFKADEQEISSFEAEFKKIKKFSNRKFTISVI